MSLPHNHKLEDLFDLARISDASGDTVNADDSAADISNNLLILPETLQALDKIESALPAVRGLEAIDTEMDELASKARESFDDLMNLGMQVDSRYASEIFSVAGTMLGHAITAKTAKMNKKLKMIDLQLRKARLDQTEDGESKLPDAQGRLLNRNDLLKALMESNSEIPCKDK